MSAFNAARSAASRPAAGDRRNTAAWRASALPWLSNRWHWLRTMLRWCGIIAVDHGLGVFRLFR